MLPMSLSVSPVRPVVPLAGILQHRLVLVLQSGARPGLDDLEVHLVAELVLVPEVGGGRAGVHEVVGGVLAGDVGEPELSLGVDRHARGVDGLEPVLALQHPVDGGRRPPVGRVAVDAERHPLLDRHRPRRLVFEVVQLGLADEDRVGRRLAPLVLRVTLVLTCCCGGKEMRINARPSQVNLRMGNVNFTPPTGLGKILGGTCLTSIIHLRPPQ